MLRVTSLRGFKPALLAGIFVCCSTPLAAATLSVPGDFSTIQRAVVKAKKGDTILVASGSYSGPIRIAVGIALVAREPHKAIIDGNSAKNTVSLKNGSSLYGFTITGGRIGIYAEGAGITIRGCLVERNSQSGISCVGQLPRIEDNVIVHNGASGIQGWDVRTADAAISHNTIAFNANHGIAMGGTSEILVENNIIASNVQFACKSEQPSKTLLKTNCIFMNVDLMAQQPEGTVLVDPQFVSPATVDFRLGETSGCRNQSSDGSDLGSRIFESATDRRNP